MSQNELDWFHQDSETQMKKWQQEKKENRENLKALRGTAKKHSDTNERYSCKEIYIPSLNFREVKTSELLKEISSLAVKAARLFLPVLGWNMDMATSLFWFFGKLQLNI